jgi:hypothetical protein
MIHDDCPGPAARNRPAHMWEGYNPYEFHRHEDFGFDSNSFLKGEDKLVRVKRSLFSIFSIALVVMASIPALNAQQSEMVAPAPVPPQIAAARRMFISNAGGASFENVISEIVFSGGADRPYNQCYAALKAWGRYELVPSPGDADIVVEVSWVLSDTGLRLPVLGQLRLVLIDPKTHVTLWNLTDYVRGAVLLGNRDKNFDQAMTTIINRMKILANQPAAPTSAPQ